MCYTSGRYFKNRRWGHSPVTEDLLGVQKDLNLSPGIEKNVCDL